MMNNEKEKHDSISIRRGVSIALQIVWIPWVLDAGLLLVSVTTSLVRFGEQEPVSQVGFLPFIIHALSSSLGILFTSIVYSSRGRSVWSNDPTPKWVYFMVLLTGTLGLFMGIMGIHNPLFKQIWHWIMFSASLLICFTLGALVPSAIDSTLVAPSKK